MNEFSKIMISEIYVSGSLVMYMVFALSDTSCVIFEKDGGMSRRVAELTEELTKIYSCFGCVKRSVVSGEERHS